MSFKINPYLASSNIWQPPIRNNNYLLLDLNENHFLTDSFFNEFVIKSEHLNIYPEYTKLQTMLSNLNGVTQDNIILTNGADQAIEIISRLCFQPQDTVIIPSPVFSYYYHVMNICGINYKAIPYYKSKNEFIFPINDILDALPQSQGIILCNPNNPLGSLIKSQDLLKIVEVCTTLNLPVIIDEAYYEYCQYTCAHLLKESENIIIIRSFSKYYALAGLRLGYIMASSDLINQMLKIRGPWDVNSLAVKLGIYCLENQSCIHDIMREFQTAKSYILNVCKDLHIESFDTFTNFILLNDSSGNIRKLLNFNKILVSNLTNYPNDFGLLENFLRLSIPPIKWVETISKALYETFEKEFI